MRIVIMNMTKTISIKKVINYGALILLFSFILIYTFFRTRAINHGVDIKISGIKNGEIIQENTILLSGKAKHAKRLLINDKEVLVDKESSFKEELILSPGYNLITISAEDKFNKKEKIVYHVFFEEKSEVAIN